MNTFVCTIHHVKFGSAPAELCKEDDKARARMAVCPVCYWQERDKHVNEIELLRTQRNHLLAAIEIKKELLVVQDGKII